MRKLRWGMLLVAIVAVVTLSLRADDQADTSALEGKDAPTFSLPTVAGPSFDLAKEKGNVVLLDFWATWCPPCRLSLPHLQKISEDKDLSAKGLKVYAVNQGESKDKAKQFIDAQHYTFNCALDKSQDVGRKYQVTGIPTTVVIGRDGKIAKVFVGYSDELETQVRDAVNAALAAPKP